MERVWSALPDARDAEIQRLHEQVQERDGVIEMILLRELRLREALNQITTEVEEILSERHTCGDPYTECPLHDCHKPGSTVDIAQQARDVLARKEEKT